ncbi:alpha/beta-hydrolase [Aspergillus filifer]
MPTDAITPTDPRVEHKFLTVEEDITYHYMLAKPNGSSKATVLLLHGWPDLALGWRYQIPYLLSLNFKVIVPDMLGYGQTSAPTELSKYSLRRMSGHLAQLIAAEADGEQHEQVFLGGHDWGAYLAYRLAIYYPHLIRGIMTFCIPFYPPEPVMTSLEDVVRGNPKFKYMLQLASPIAEEIVSRSSEYLAGFLRSLFGAVTSDGQAGFSIGVGVLEDTVAEVGESPLVGREIMDFYVNEYTRTGINGPMNWYRTREINVAEEVSLALEAEKEGKAAFELSMPAMIVMGGFDEALPPSLLDGQEKHFPEGLVKKIIPGSSHWVLIHFPEEVNAFTGEFVRGILERN